MNLETVLEIDLKKLKNNIKLLNKSYSDYKYKYVDLRNNAFGMGYEIVGTLEDSGIYGCMVENVKEALLIRKRNKKINILVLNSFTTDEVYDAINNNITLTIKSKEELDLISSLQIKDDLKVEILISNTSIIEGISNLDGIRERIKDTKHLKLVGLYSYLTSFGISDEYYYHQVNEVYKVLENIELGDLIIHLNEPLMYHSKLSFVNGISFDLAVMGMEENIKEDYLTKQKIKKIEKKYGALEFPNINLELIFTIRSEIIAKSYLNKGTLVGNSHVLKEDTWVGVVPIGHKDGITKAIKFGGVNGFKRAVLADDIDRLYIKLEEKDDLHDKVYILNEERGIYDFLESIKVNRYYLMSILNKNIRREYINKDEKIKDLL